MNKQKAEKLLSRIEVDLNSVSTFLEGAGFTTQSDELDTAGECVERVQYSLSRL